jgi:hypothetical protein
MNHTIGCSFNVILKVGVEESIVNAPRITADFLRCLCFYSAYWCVHNRPFNAYFVGKFKWTPDIIISVLSELRWFSVEFTFEAFSDRCKAVQAMQLQSLVLWHHARFLKSWLSHGRSLSAIFKS